MKANQFNEMNIEELNSTLVEKKAELFNLRFQLATGQLSNPMVIKECKRDIARVKTIIRDKEIKAAVNE